MIRDAYSIALQPLLPWPVIAALFGCLVALSALALWRGARGALMRLLAGGALATILLHPTLVREERNYQSDIAIVVVDRSPSQSLERRNQQADEAIATLKEAAKSMPDLELRIVETNGGQDHAENGTRLFEAAREALASVPRGRLAGLVMATDGQVHDVPENATDLGLGAPLHVLLTGDPSARDRRVIVAEAPGFGLIGKDFDITVRVEDLGASEQSSVDLALRHDGSPIAPVRVLTGKDTIVRLPLDHGGQNVYEINVDASPGELTLANNSSVLTVNGVRDRLKVLLISGEPYPGERTWRNLLKSDPSVELIHFTILRPPNKQDATPINELALIAFPIDELFDIKLKEFDLIIFDRFQHLGILPDEYFVHIADYVREGGAVLESAGPSSAGQFSLYRTPLTAIFAAAPTGEVRMQGFTPQVTPVGQRHPVTNELAGSDPTKPNWGRWFRQMPANVERGNVLMSGVDGLPLLVLDRVGKGRVAQFFSDHLWLWSRGFEGGGPHAELIRRIVHWLMRETDLEEEDLRASVVDGTLEVRRQSLSGGEGEVVATDPEGRATTMKLSDSGKGRGVARIKAETPGLYKVSDGQRTAFAANGTLNSKEWLDPRASGELLLPLVKETRGGIVSLTRDGEPTWRRVGPEGAMAGQGWLGLRSNAAYTVTGIRETDLFPGWLALLAALGLVLAAWRRESKI
jgi:uncharacterized membrane protein